MATGQPTDEPTSQVPHAPRKNIKKKQKQKQNLTKRKPQNAMKYVHIMNNRIVRCKKTIYTEAGKHSQLA